ncbi:uncharacterized protein LOC121599507 [Anopheles merus]|uniref:uncharacterized protein LOC121599507 n=1 Tax=Anopheles merus TaxID=30066 RepID=UPI001BE4CC7B|nr:uncharacterized protein LOC121599507 [Anopheles merus]
MAVSEREAQQPQRTSAARNGGTDDVRELQEIPTTNTRSMGETLWNDGGNSTTFGSFRKLSGGKSRTGFGRKNSSPVVRNRGRRPEHATGERRHVINTVRSMRTHFTASCDTERYGRLKRGHTLLGRSPPTPWDVICFWQCGDLDWGFQ